MNKYSTFIFKSYKFSESDKTLTLNYSYDDKLELSEKYKFDFDFVDYSKQELNQAAQILFFLAGVSYFKMYLAVNIDVRAGKIDPPLADFLASTYQNGLREFFYVNNLDVLTPVKFPVNSDQIQPAETKVKSGKLVAVGGGKDSLVSVELLRDAGVNTWSVSHKSQLAPLVNKIGLNHLYIEREIDPIVLELNQKGAYNGHIPISAILGAVGAVTAVLSGNQDIVMSNESSANEPTLYVNSSPVNHQYSKSLDYEIRFSDLLNNLFGGSIRYYSLLRSLSELRIAEIFAKLYFDKYKSVFSSCNRAFTHDQNELFWCGKCPKCAFIFLILTPFIDRQALEKLWDGKNLLLDSSLDNTYSKLLGIYGDKPLDCVGEIKESRAAMNLAFKVYPELKEKYEFDLPKDYDYKSLAKNNLPSEINKLLRGSLGSLGF